MATLIVTVLYGLVIGYFATQNTGVISLYFMNYMIPNVPIYIVVGGALLAGLCISGLISLVNDVSTVFTMWGKDSKIDASRKENAQLLSQIHQLELENTKLIEKTKSHSDKKSR